MCSSDLICRIPEVLAVWTMPDVVEALIVDAMINYSLVLEYCLQLPILGRLDSLYLLGQMGYKHRLIDE